MTTEELVKRILALPRSTPVVDNGCCELCGTSADMDECEYGNWISIHQLENLFKELKDGN